MPENVYYVGKDIFTIYLRGVWKICKYGCSTVDNVHWTYKYFNNDQFSKDWYCGEKVVNLRGREIYENLQCRGGAGGGFYFSSQIFDRKAFTFDLWFQIFDYKAIQRCCTEPQCKPMNLNYSLMHFNPPGALMGGTGCRLTTISNSFNSFLLSNGAVP